MPQISPKLYRAQDSLLHYCPGCKELHIIPMGGVYKLNWNFDNNLQSPTFNPSVKHNWGKDECCHYFIHNGIIKYCSDCTHELSGKELPLPDIPSDVIEGWSE